MEAGRTFKASVAASVIVHAALLGALLFASFSISGGKRQVFFVELKEARLVAPKVATKTESKSAAQRKAEPVKKKLAEPKRVVEVVEKNAPEVKEETAPVSEAAFRHEAPAMAEAVQTEALPAGAGDSSRNNEGSAAATETPGQVLEAGLENFALSSGPVTPRPELLARIRQAIEEELTYPPLAKRRRIEGTVLAGFSIDERGVPRGIEIVESSGFSVLDKEVVEIIRRASPYPYVPERVEIPVSFRLVEGR